MTGLVLDLEPQPERTWVRNDGRQQQAMTANERLSE
jgi:hypothetical protein